VGAKAGRIDITLNAATIMHAQGTPFPELSLEDFMHPNNTLMRTNFITAQAVARHMTDDGSGLETLEALRSAGGRAPAHYLSRMLARATDVSVDPLSLRNSSLNGGGLLIPLLRHNR
jgi:3-oxoacyl-[acyl-carrier protein] reductase